LNYTPGEWKADHNTSVILTYDKDGEVEHVVARHVVENDIELIASAKQMYEALEVVLPWAKEWINYLQSKVGKGQGKGAEEWFKKADKALAKAEGKTDG
jgi:hypothetical protein